MGLRLQNDRMFHPDHGGPVGTNLAIVSRCDKTADVIEQKGLETAETTGKRSKKWGRHNNSSIPTKQQKW